VVLFRNILVAFLVISGATPGWSQILDDTTKLIYGPETTKYLYEKDIRYNSGTYQNIDTLLDNVQRFDPIDKLSWKYQYLGTMGTAATPVYYTQPDIIGLDHGFHAYDIYYKDPSKFRYFDTKSPYMELLLSLGGGRRSFVDWEVSRNINQNWSVGGGISSMVVDKQYGAERSRGDRNVESVGYNFFTHFKSNDSSYQFLANFSRLKHTVFETGGVIAEDTSTQDDLFEVLFDRDAEIWLRNSESSDLRQNVHFFHQIKFSRLAQVYHTFDRIKQFNSFTVAPLTEDSAFFDQILIDNDTTRDRSRFRSIQNEVGLKGEVRQLFYNFYYKRKKIKWVPQYLPVEGPLTENYGGFLLRYGVNPETQLNLEAEYLQGGNYKAAAGISYKIIDAEIRRIKYQPSFLVQNYFGNHSEWHNNFTSPISDRLKVGVNLNYKNWKFRPFASLTRVDRHIYFDQKAQPQQAPGEAQIFSGGLDITGKFLRFVHFKGQLIANNVSGTASELFLIPDITTHGQVYYEKDWFNRRIHVQLGVDFHWKSTYFAYDYDPATQQFILQNELEVPNYLVADIFLNFQLIRGLVFLKVINVLEGVQAAGYMATPYYPGQDRGFDFGVKWLFFD